MQFRLDASGVGDPNVNTHDFPLWLTAVRPSRPIEFSRFLLQQSSSSFKNRFGKLGLEEAAKESLGQSKSPSALACCPRIRWRPTSGIVIEGCSSDQSRMRARRWDARVRH